MPGDSMQIENLTFDETKFSHPVVLLVDDQPMVAEAVRRMLAPEGDIVFHYCQDPTKAIDVANQVCERGEFQTFNQRAAFPNGRRKFERLHFGKVGGNFFHNADGVVAAAIEDDDQLKFARVIFPKIFRVFAQHRLDPALLIVGRNQQQ